MSKEKEVTVIGNETRIVIKKQKPASKKVKKNRDTKKQNARGK